MLEVMQRFKPEVVFHAAAYKHVPLMEANPLEAVRNNAIATQVTAKTAAVAGAERFVLVSTDKAVNPRTVMGATKAMAEWIVAAAGAAATRRPGSRSSASATCSPPRAAWSRSSARRSSSGGPVTVTHPEMTRYFMTIPEAVQLVIQAGDLGAGSGEVFVLEMGEPVKILDLARNMIRLAGYEPEADIAIEFIGVAPGREAPRGALQRRRAPAADAADRIVRAVRRRAARPGLGRATRSTRLAALVAAGDEAGLAEHVVELMRRRAARRATRWLDRAPARAASAPSRPPISA